ncbi:SDR family NAD(P)-dependent oxidoreductase [Streptomyces sp. NPDC090088]|uniref:SDR family NAD(P)-dependent oxidoreductase n=1 Tax=Streptomyces sp. NPDC090088 TaxID=3365944 RepID=UPI00380749E7
MLMDELRFDGKAALVTGVGASGSIGREHAIELARRGASVVVNDVASRDGYPIAQALVDEITAEGGTAHAYVGSVATEDGARDAVRRTVELLGAIDILVNNAGNVHNGVVGTMSTADFDADVQLNLMGPFWTMSEALPQMRARGYGRIVNTTSASGAFGSFRSPGYAAAKAGVIGLTRAVALDNPDWDLKVNAVAPLAASPRSRDWFESLDNIDAGLLRPELIAPPVAYLCHEQCDVNGSVLSVGAGRVAIVFTGTVPGYLNRDLTAEDISLHLDQVLDRRDYEVPGSQLEQYPLFGIMTDR